MANKTFWEMIKSEVLNLYKESVQMNLNPVSRKKDGMYFYIEEKLKAKYPDANITMVGIKDFMCNEFFIPVAHEAYKQIFNK